MNKIVISVALFLAIAFNGIAAESTKEIPASTSNKQALAPFEQGQKFLDLGRTQEASPLFKKALDLDPAFSYAHLNKALSSTSTPEFKQELDAALKSVQGKSEGERLLIEMNQTFISNDAKKRIELAERLVKLYPDSPRAWLALGTMHGSLNQNEAARKSMSRALQLDPKLIAGHIALGFNYIFGLPRDLKKAEVHMKRCVEIAPKEGKCEENLGDVYRAMNRLEEARQHYAKALELDPELSVASLKKGHINSFLGNYEEAFADYDKGVEGAKESNKINYANYRAFTHVHAGNPGAALEDLSKLVTSAGSIGLSADDVRATKIFTLNNEATIALHHNMFDQAKNILSQLEAVQLDTQKQVQDQNFSRVQKANLILLQAQLAARQKDFATAKTKAEENRKLMESDENPRRLEGYYALLGLSALLQKDYAGAVENYKKSDLTNISNNYNYATALDNSGRSDEARKIFKDVSEFNFNTPDFALVRKDALKRIS